MKTRPGDERVDAAVTGRGELARRVQARVGGPGAAKVSQVEAALALLEEGATVPFIARYRKERTGGLDEVLIRAIEEAREAILELDKRRDAIIKSLDDQGISDVGLRERIARCESRAELEDLYLPYKKKRKTRASVARERGLTPLAEAILAQRVGGEAPQSVARRFVRGEVSDVEAALAGARDIVAELVTEMAEVRAHARAALLEHGRLVSKANPKTTQGVRTAFEDYYEHTERVARLPSHRVLAMLRGESEGFLKLELELDDERLVGDVLRRAGWERRSAWAGELEAAVRDGYRRLLRPQLDTEVMGTLKERADLEAIAVFARNLESLLMASPLGARAVLGLDPGFRTGVKAAMVSASGEVLAVETLMLHASGASERARSVSNFEAMVSRFAPYAVAIGNGTASRETEALVSECLVKGAGGGKERPIVVMVNEAGASVYSASELAREELPGLDVTYRGAVSIARRLQDPLSELVKVEAQALGVGQYQHDVDQKLLTARLDAVVESAVNRVGVDLNTASPALLKYVAGIGPGLAKKIVERRAALGKFVSRRQLLEVGGLGKQRFEQCAGFLRIRGGGEPLDASAVHPERYGLVAKIARDLGCEVGELIGARVAIDIGRYVDGEVGEPTLRDILDELAKPGRDPRKSFEPPRFREDIKELKDLYVDLELEGVVTNVTSFGAFVDIGVHQDGLVHISRLAERFVRDPHEVVRPGDRVTVKVLEVDLQRKRIALQRVGQG